MFFLFFKYRKLNAEKYSKAVMDRQEEGYLTGGVKVPVVDMPAGGRKKQFMYLLKASILSDNQL